MPQITIRDIQTIIAEQLRCNLSKVSPDTDIRNLGAFYLDLSEICSRIEEEYNCCLEGIVSIDTNTIQLSLSISQEITPAILLEHCSRK